MAAKRSTSRTRRVQLWLLPLAAVGFWALGFYFRVVTPGPVAMGHSAAATAAQSPAPEVSPRTGGAAGAASAGGAAGVELGAGGLGGGGSAAAGGAGGGDADAGGLDGGVPVAAEAGTRRFPDTAREISACVASLFPEASFDLTKIDLSFVCKEPYPRRALTRIQSQVVMGKWGRGGASEGMKEWAVLGWYGLAAYSVFRGECCAAPAAPVWTFKLACPVDEAMSAIERAVRTRDDAAMAEAVGAYSKATRCLAKLGQGRNFGLKGSPGAGVGSFQKIHDRARQRWK